MTKNFVVVSEAFGRYSPGAAKAACILTSGAEARKEYMSSLPAEKRAEFLKNFLVAKRQGSFMGFQAFASEPSPKNPALFYQCSFVYETEVNLP